MLIIYVAESPEILRVVLWAMLVALFIGALVIAPECRNLLLWAMFLALPLGVGAVAPEVQSLADDARILFLGWVSLSSVPGHYTTAAQRAEVSDHPGDLSHIRIFHEGDFGATAGDRPWPHTKPNPIYESAAERQRMLEAVAWLLRRGMSRLQDAVLVLITTVAATQIELLLSLAQRALNSFEDFWRTVSWTVDYGERQVEWHVEEEQKEYGPETNFWLKFRPLLSCHHTPRLGPELGGAKAWCNPASWPKPRYILSAGVGDDMLFETIAAQMWPGVILVMPDCYQYSNAAAVEPPSWNGSSGLHLPVCLTGEDGAYTRLAPGHLRERFITYPLLLREMRNRYARFEGFEFIKCNIEASEYPLFAHIMREVDTNLRGTVQINIEMHRMGMHAYDHVPGMPPGGGRSFHSLLFMQLLWATFLSGGFHPVFVEKWHDLHAAEDVVWVNQTWWLQSELEAVRSIWNRSWPDVPVSESTYPDAAALARQHAAGEDPYLATNTARSIRKKRKTGSTDGTSSARGLTLDAVGLQLLRASDALAMLRVDPPSCTLCEALQPVWTMVASNIEAISGSAVSVHKCSCAEDPDVCAELGQQDGSEPAFGVWTGSHFEWYAGERSNQALVEWLVATVKGESEKRAAAMRERTDGSGVEKIPTGGWS